MSDRGRLDDTGLDEPSLERRRKLAELIESNIKPYGCKFERTDTTEDVRAAHQDLRAGIETSHEVRVAGRIRAKRVMGKASFAHIQDGYGRLQIYLKEDAVGRDAYELFKKLDVGDFIGVTGNAFCTRTGELSIFVKNFVLLTKSLRALPDKWHSLRDVETRYRQRYVDLMVNAEVKHLFILRSRIIQTIREFLASRGFIEVETPMLQPIPGGADASPFVTHYNVLGDNFYLRIAPELYLKRLIVAGFDRVYELNRNFRNEGISTRHNPEFTMLELYEAYADYHAMMRLTETLVSHVAETVLGDTRIVYQGTEIRLQPPWHRITFIDAIEQYAKVELPCIEDQDELEAVAAKFGISSEPASDKCKIIKQIFEKEVEPKLIQPTFVMDYPTSLSPLARTKEEEPALVERFEPFVGGLELGNAFSELTNPIEQERRFKEQLEYEDREKESKMLDRDFITALEYGIPPTGGLGIGIDRLVMLLTNSRSIREVILFPQLRPKKT